MNQSESIKELSAAINKFQSGLAGVKKGTKNPFFRSNYATLAEIQQAIREPLEHTGLSYTQSHEKQNDEWVLVTRIMHTSGQWMDTIVPAPMVPLTKRNDVDPQAVGSANSYAKRYGITQAFGIPTVDDDGNAASYQTQPRQLQSGPELQSNKKPNWTMVTQPQIKRMYAIIGAREEAGWTVDKAKEYAQKTFGISSSSQLSKAQYEQLINIIQENDWEVI